MQKRTPWSFQRWKILKNKQVINVRNFRLVFLKIIQMDIEHCKDKVTISIQFAKD